MTGGSGRRAGRPAKRVLLSVLLAGALAGFLFTTSALAERSPWLTDSGDPRTARNTTGETAAAPLPTDWRDTANTTIALTGAGNEEAGDANTRQLLSCLDVRDAGTDGLFRRLVALPDCDAAFVESVILVLPDGTSRSLNTGRGGVAWVEGLARLRAQTLAIVAVDPAGLDGDLRISVTPVGARGPTFSHAGPLTGALESTVLNYRAPEPSGAAWQPPSGPSGRERATATYCYSVEDCAAAGVDILIVAADQLHFSPILQAFANHHATYLGLNVGVVGTSALRELTAEALRDFIRDVYDTQSAAHFGDGHLGFVVLVGDAFADDNETVMIPTYDGYGGTEVASDHYYACVSGEDDFEDVMIGRLSVGNQTELAAVVGKSVNYMPLPDSASWRESVLLVAGLFYTLKDDYVQLFDEYEELVPSDWSVDRIYRHDYTSNHDCSVDVINAFNSGHLIVNYAGDGWISSWHQVMDTTDFPLMTNADRLPIVLSMACMTGWYDNITELDQTGSYDCFAEQIVNRSGGGAVACLASPRASDGGMFRTLTKDIYRAAFQEHSIFIGETMAVAKLLHVQSGGSVDYARHFNLFGDPSLIYRWDAPPSARPELIVSPHATVVSPELPAIGNTLTLDISVSNMSTLPVDGVVVRVSDVCAAGTYSQDVVVPSIGSWSSSTVTVTIPSLTRAWHSVTVTVDPNGTIEELDEDNNSFTFSTYVYPHVAGFPATSGLDPHGPCVARLGGRSTQIITMESEARIRSMDSAGQTLWVTDPTSDPADYGPEVTPAVGDLNGDGQNEVVATRRMGLAAFDADGQPLWEKITDDPVGSPVLADADADGDLDVILAVKMFFGGSSKIIAVDEDGDTIWTYSLPSGDPASATPVAGDFDQDGFIDFAFGTSSGKVGAASCSQTPPVQLWAPLAIDSGPIDALGLADTDDDGILELVAVGSDAHCRNSEDGTSSWSEELLSSASGMAIADVDADGTVDVLIGTEAGQLLMIENGRVSWTTTLSGRTSSSFAVADLRGDAEAEIVVRTEDGSLHILDSDGDWLIQPVPIPGGGCCSPFVADLTEDGNLEACVASSDGHVFAFNFGGTSNDPVIEWQGAGGNHARTGVLVQPFSGTFSQGAVLQGRYLFTGDVTVDAGAAVRVLPGTVLEFDSDASAAMTVWGELTALGQPGREIVIRPKPIRTEASWDGIDLRAGSTASFTSCVVSGADVAIRGSQASVGIDDCVFTDNTYGAYLTGCVLDVTASAFSYSDSIGMYLSGGSGSVGTCVFDANGKSGLWLQNYASHSVAGSMFSGTTAGSGLVCYRFSDAQVDSCTSAGNAGHGILVHNSSPSISGCTVTGNTLNGIMCRKLSEPTVCWSTVQGNRIGVVAETGAFPNLGDLENPDTGDNSIMGNQQAAVANYSSTEFPVQCRGNWWGSYPPVGRIFIGFVRYYPCLTGVPTPGHGKLLADGDPEEADPLSFALLGNTPNPFNPTTTIAFDVPAGGGPLEVAVFDVAGRRVATLYSGHHDPGTHSVTWDGRDERGQDVASGIYFARLSASGFSDARKMLLLK